uniref:Uncharacterized protein n=1 Tax=Anguilla anguilla TaxID=7936 RepID=A0A0E9Q898_ANGAN
MTDISLPVTCFFTQISTQLRFACSPYSKNASNSFGHQARSKDNNG